MGVIDTRLFTTCQYCGNRFYLSTVYPSKRNIPKPLTIRCPFCQSKSYCYPNEIYAEPGYGAPLAGGALGAIIGGLIGGPVGLLLGGALGGMAGTRSDQQDRENAQRFNEEVV